MILQGGATANMTGSRMESTIKKMILDQGYWELSEAQKKFFICHDGEAPGFEDKWFCAQAPLDRNLYEAKYRSDFILYNKELFPNLLQIEVKCQISPGSVDEKYVFTVLSLKKFRGHKILILDGEGARKGAITWLRSQTDKKRGFEFINGIGAFMTWSHHNL